MSFKKWLPLRSRTFFDPARSRFAAKGKLTLSRSFIAFACRYAATAEPLSPEKPSNRAK
jgi:hypothetical protein